MSSDFSNEPQRQTDENDERPSQWHPSVEVICMGTMLRRKSETHSQQGIVGSSQSELSDGIQLNHLVLRSFSGKS